MIAGRPKGAGHDTWRLRAAAMLPADRQRQRFELGDDRWAKSFMDQKRWQEAIGVYDQGLARLPDSGLFKNNREYCRAQMK